MLVPVVLQSHGAAVVVGSPVVVLLVGVPVVDVDVGQFNGCWVKNSVQSV